MTVHQVKPVLRIGLCSPITRSPRSMHWTKTSDRCGKPTQLKRVKPLCNHSSIIILVPITLTCLEYFSQKRMGETWTWKNGIWNIWTSGFLACLTSRPYVKKEPPTSRQQARSGALYSPTLHLWLHLKIDLRFFYALLNIAWLLWLDDAMMVVPVHLLLLGLGST